MCSTVAARVVKGDQGRFFAYGLPLVRTRSHTLCWEYSSRVALTQRWRSATCPLGWALWRAGALELNLPNSHMTKQKNTPDPSPQPDEAKKPCTEAAHGAGSSVASKRKAEDLPTLMSVFPFTGWSPFKKFMVIKSIGT
ncbi:hypothetical protein PoB_004438200 [Plakobranchus ocellatus]|uniref:Uncharacterized protein n=1 Tax=Plakobranchus ocellatus TaxID=259542 RepID=A0AAV4BF82_9GAST|nr:hypothetical protein PoB_004438200 [Plakobranchus ocellatus]